MPIRSKAARSKAASIMALSAIMVAGTQMAASTADAAQAGDIVVRGRLVGVMPTSESEGLETALPTASVTAKSAIVPELDISYMVTDNIGLELIATTTHHNVKGGGAISSLGNVAETWLLPPSVLAQYHFDGLGRFKPYVGAGINYTFTYAENASGSLESALGGPTTVELDNSFGWAAQIGVDYSISDNMYFNFDVKYISLDVDATITSGATTLRTDVGINPVIIGAGIGFRF